MRVQRPDVGARTSTAAARCSARAARRRPTGSRARATVSGRSPGSSAVKPLPANIRWPSQRGERSVVVEHVAHVVGEPGVVLGLAAVADKHPLLGHQVVDGERGEGRQHHPPGEVAGRTEQDEDREGSAPTLRGAVISRRSRGCAARAGRGDRTRGPGAERPPALERPLRTSDARSARCDLVVESVSLVRQALSPGRSRHGEPPSSAANGPSPLTSWTGSLDGLLRARRPQVLRHRAVRRARPRRRRAGTRPC